MCNMHVSSLFAELQKLNSMVWHYHQSELAKKLGPLINNKYRLRYLYLACILAQ